MRPALVVVPTGTANIASVLASFRRLGADPVVAGTPEMAESARQVVLPGVGSFGAAMGELDRTGMREVLAERLHEARATLAICVGMQLLAGSSEESDGVRGLGHVESPVERFSDTVRVPQLGWNQVVAGPGCTHLSDGWAYFANSYRITDVPSEWSLAFSDHGGEYVAGMERGQVLACQFHPELSGSWGMSVLGSWIEATGKVS